ncbi:MAG: GGDEF domain-containing protein [Lachnospiraceae bacterium]|nr:GGDEF domain-containing protein [Lachnospiraceae bacterium]
MGEGRQMRRRIGVFMGEITSEYQIVVLKSIFKKAGELDYDVFVFCNFGAYGDNVLYAEGEKGIIRLPDCSKLDGIIVAEDTFDIDGMEGELQKLLEKKAACPVVYIRDAKENFYNVLVEGGEAIADMVRHFIIHHGFRDICFMTGDMRSQDARERYQSFLSVMEEAKIPVTKHMVFEGDYWRKKGKEAVDWFMEGRDSYPQAIICSNDYMALSVCDELKKRGVRIPEEVCVSGYDDLPDARRYQPSLTSIKAPFESMGVKAVEMIDNICAGREQKRVEWLKPSLQLRRSCGCGEQGELEDLSWMLSKIYVEEDNIKQSVFMTTDYQDAFEEEEYLKVAEKYLQNVNCSKAYLCMCNTEEKSFEAAENDNYFSEKMILKRIFTRDSRGIKYEEEFDRGSILPDSVLSGKEAQGYLVFSIHYKNKSYGYMVFTFEDDEWPDSYVSAYLTSLANAIEDAYMHQELSGLEQIKKLYYVDSLTGIYNRRGYEKHLRSLHERYEDERKYLSIVSIDMNGLKYINDNFGHAEGDEALCRLAKVLEKLIEEDEICARVGGDEFSVLLYSPTRERSIDFERQFISAMQEEEKRCKKPYPFQASVGICCISDEKDLSLMSCMQLADKRMYIQKRKNKFTRENMH